MNIFTGVLLLVLYPIFVRNECSYTSQEAGNLLRSIDRIVNTFYKNHFQKITMRSDGGVGLGVLKGQLNYLLGQREDKFSPKLKESLEKLHQLSGKLALQILDQFIESNFTDSTKKFGIQTFPTIQIATLQARFRSWLPHETIVRHFKEFENIDHKKEDILYPSLGFECLVKLVNDCNISPECQKMYLTDIYSQYNLTHQIMYQQFAERRSCIALNKKAFGNAQEFRDRLCSKAYLEAQNLANKNYPKRSIGLFAEQVGFCGLNGYPNFMRKDWVEEILSWQYGSKSGCFPKFYAEENITDPIVVVHGIVDNKSFKENCLIHLTSVSLMALSVNLRYILDICSPNIFDGQFL